MAQNITIMGASYSDVPAVQLPKTGGGTARFDDASITTATASDVASGKVFLAADGTITTGTSSGGGGSSSWTKIAETSYQVSTTSTSAITVGTWATGHTDGQYTEYTLGASNGYGVYLRTVYSDGRILIGARYSSAYSLTIDSTYSVEVYLLDPPAGAPIFT